jgi:hypothetical protein
MSHQYPVFEAAITGRIALEGSWEGAQDSAFRRASSIIDMVPQTEEEKDDIRNAVRHEGVLLSLLDVLRRVPRRVLMVLKLNDLTRYEWYVSFFIACSFLLQEPGSCSDDYPLQRMRLPFHGMDVYLTDTERSESSLLLLNIVRMQSGRKKDNI